MTRTRRRSLASAGLLPAALAAASGLLAAAGCTNKVEAPKPVSRYVTLPADPNMPAFMQGTVHDRAQLLNTDVHQVSGYGLVGQLRGTGDTSASNPVRQFMYKEMIRRGFANSQLPGFEKLRPEDVLKDPSYAIVRVDAFIPPGARKDDWIDAQVSCLPQNRTTSLAHGQLFESDLTDGGADADVPGAAVNVRVVVKGPITLNPAYALEDPQAAAPEAKESLRTGAVQFNARVKADRPLMLQLRQPERKIARRIQAVVATRFQDDAVAAAQDEGVVNLYVPKSFRGDWQRFAEVVRHLYLNGDDAAFNVAQAARLAAEAVKPNAPLEDIAYCWEGLGHHAVPAIRPLLTHADQRVAFFAARAAAFIGDPTQAAETRLMQMAQAPDHPYRLAAVRTLGQLPPSASLNGVIRGLLDSEMTLIRVEAYQILARYQDQAGTTDRAIYRTVVAPPDDARNQKFFLDVVPGNGPPLVYVSRSGPPRVAVIGRQPVVDVRSPFTTFDNRLTLAGADKGRYAVLFFRDPRVDHPIKVVTEPALPQVVARLGGMGAERTEVMNLTYGEVVAVLQKLVEANRVSAPNVRGREVAAAFVMQEPGRLQDDLANAPLIAVTGGDLPAAPGLAPQRAARPPRPVAANTGDRAGPGTAVPAFGPPAPSFGPATPAVGTPTTPGRGTNAPAFGGTPATPAAQGESNAPKF